MPCCAWSWNSFPSWQRSWRQGTFAGWYTPAGDWHSAGRPGDSRGNRQSTGSLSSSSLWPREALRVAGRRLWGQDWSDSGRRACWNEVKELRGSAPHPSPLPFTHSFAVQAFSLAVALPLGPALPRIGGVGRARGEDAGLLDAGNRLQVGDS